MGGVPLGVVRTTGYAARALMAAGSSSGVPTGWLLAIGAACAGLILLLNFAAVESTERAPVDVEISRDRSANQSRLAEAILEGRGQTTVVPPTTTPAEGAAADTTRTTSPFLTALLVLAITSTLLGSTAALVSALRRFRERHVQRTWLARNLKKLEAQASKGGPSAESGISVVNAEHDGLALRDIRLDVLQENETAVRLVARLMASSRRPGPETPPGADASGRTAG